MNKSEELCKLLGIKPIKKDCPHKGCRNHITHPCEVCNNKRFIYAYPDLTKPSNFLKLLNINFKSRWGKPTGFADCFDNACKFYYEKNMYWANKAKIKVDNNDFYDCFLASIIIEIMIFESEDFDIDSENRKIKQQAQQVEWAY